MKDFEISVDAIIKTIVEKYRNNPMSFTEKRLSAIDDFKNMVDAEYKIHAPNIQNELPQVQKMLEDKCAKMMYYNFGTR